MDDDLLEWDFVGEMQGLEDHTADPEEDDVITSDKNAGWEITIEIWGLFWPTKGSEWL